MRGPRRRQDAAKGSTSVTRCPTRGACAPVLAGDSCPAADAGRELPAEHQDAHGDEVLSCQFSVFGLEPRTTTGSLGLPRADACTASPLPRRSTPARWSLGARAASAVEHLGDGAQSGSRTCARRGASSAHRAPGIVGRAEQAEVRVGEHPISHGQTAWCAAARAPVRRPRGRGSAGRVQRAQPEGRRSGAGPSSTDRARCGGRRSPVRDTAGIWLGRSFGQSAVADDVGSPSRRTRRPVEAAAHVPGPDSSRVRGRSSRQPLDRATLLRAACPAR